MVATSRGQERVCLGLRGTTGVPLGVCKPGDNQEQTITGIVPGQVPGTQTLRNEGELRPGLELAQGTLERALEECVSF